MQEKHYEVVIVGGGISGGALAYTLAQYTDIKSIAIIEKYEGLATLNTKGTANSQTIHCGDIETNYTIDKAKKVKRAADMIAKYCKKHDYIGKFIFEGQKMAIGVGDSEVAFIKDRYEVFKELYPYLEFYDKDKLKQIEPKVIFDSNGNPRPEDVAGLGVQTGAYTTIDFGAMTNTLVENAQKTKGKICDLYLNSEVQNITKVGDKFYIRTANKISVSADFVVVDAGAHSLWLAHKMGYGKSLSAICIAGSFYLTKQKLLNGKVYMVQNPKLPFAALHGDPDLLADGCTRFGPTALTMPKLERYKGCRSVPEFFQSLNFTPKVAKVFWNNFGDSDVRNFLMRNIAFEVPVLGKKLFIKNAKKIIPSIREEDIYYAKGFGGVRAQIIDQDKLELLLGEARIDDNNGVIFNMTPSPGATSCFGNAERDAISICSFLGKKFDAEKFENELVK
ncbi:MULTISPECIES: FAD-dependent oxidoreductase [unclassified Campylobacter]|uniref:FAD-dependent oxidoreductase n=1 Tax=unclassified Campylobacter TaxID=2593542 RepID=UPI0022E9B663|nr:MULTISPECIES: FAD-dependent oxidoreductase [unclassified Campylobacter]MDA3042713.1 FAD-dependent oxidoreductase [Campylobacter sp. JMF_09 ED2]MDA3044473.1 FAD-dependent oxidoreductase [Campylobacter sp. JMF_07 ED4]MDA3063404.1 FAD-dependent oxidoreductase [Campylobacter sp. JMF_11 EL3]MDA3071450.1 FAD-dependent oxidoreductase [Campylobacter sp. VBCF_03 NA9]MDA3074486.1 FAD-dependent oxidoreductase [Campylobacter sp. JMF_05 ED3]